MNLNEYKEWLKSEIESKKSDAREAEEDGDNNWAQKCWCESSGLSAALEKFNEVENL